MTRRVYGAFTGSTALIKFSTGARTLYTLASAMAAGASDVAKAVNTLLSFSDDDQHALLKVIQDYFCLPEDGTDQVDDDESMMEKQHWKVKNNGSRSSRNYYNRH